MWRDNLSASMAENKAQLHLMAAVLFSKKEMYVIMSHDKKDLQKQS